jgi:hypothetical protein
MAPANTIIFLALLIAFAVIGSLIVQRQRSLRLKRRFGPEYDLTVAEFRRQTGGEVDRRPRRADDQDPDRDIFHFNDPKSNAR